MLVEEFLEEMESDLDLRHLTPEEYIEAEKHSEIRHEYFDGTITAMASCSEEHEMLAGNLAYLLYTYLQGQGRRVYKSGMKVRVIIKGKIAFYYPDVMVVCDPSDKNSYFRVNPKLLIEVMSRDKGKDLVEKLEGYKSIEALEEYLVFGQNPERPEVNIFRRRAQWEPVVVTEGAFLLESVGLELRVADLYSAS